MIFYKIAAPVFRAVGFLGLVVGLFCFVLLIADGSIMSLPWAFGFLSVFLGSLALIWVGDRLKKKISASDG